MGLLRKPRIPRGPCHRYDILVWVDNVRREFLGMKRSGSHKVDEELFDQCYLLLVLFSKLVF